VSAEVRFHLDEDGEHVWYYHACDHTGFQPDGTVAGQLPVTPEPQHMLPRGKEKCWTVVQTNPLTVQPSILCGSCGLHGFITNGQWVTA
jgi:hypothetical protein